MSDDTDAPGRRSPGFASARRNLIKVGIGLGLGVGLSPAPMKAQDDPAAAWPTEGDLLVKATDSTAKPLALEDIPVGAGPTMAWAMDPSRKIVRKGSRLNRVLLLRFDPKALQPATRASAAAGVVAYTAICPHTGCEVEEWLPDEQLLSCPCHFTRFDPRDGARVLDGPAPRPLPSLPLKLAGGTLLVAKSFTTPVGFEPA
jgi:Rieske Fe-S protein